MIYTDFERSANMKTSDKISLLKQLSCDSILRTELFYDILEECGALKLNYSDYATTHPIDCRRELLRLPTADYGTCCALLTMLLREDHFSNGSFERRQRAGEVRPIVDKMIALLSHSNTPPIKQFSEMTLHQLNGFYVYALIDPRDNQIFYIGKGTGNRVFSHEAESGKSPQSEKAKLQRIQEIESAGCDIKRLILNWGLTEAEAFAAEATLINLMNYISPDALTNTVAGHHVHESLTVEDFELLYGAEHLAPKDIRHNVLCIKINQRYHRDMTSKELYDAVRGIWRASMNTIRSNRIEYVFGVYNQLIVAVYKPDEWHYVHEQIDAPHLDELDADEFERARNRVYFICADYEQMDENQQFYLHKSIADLKVNQSAQNPITYLLRSNQN
jgi:hypothetical protein